MAETILERTNRLLGDPDAMRTIYSHIANGGYLPDLCEMWQVKYSDVTYWIHNDKEREKLYINALEARQEWAVQRLLSEIQKISFINIKQLFNEDHTLKPPSEWPADIAASVSSIEVMEEFAGTGNEKMLIGHTKKIKLLDKLKAIEMLGKDLGRFVAKHEVTGKITLEDLVNGSIKKES